MQIGTFENIDDGEGRTQRVAKPSFAGGRSPGSSKGGNGGGPNDGGDGPDGNFDLADENAQPHDKTRILTGFVLLVVLMTFGGLIGAYVVIATNRALEWKPFDLPVQVWISTAIIIISSITYEIARRALEKNAVETSKRFLVATTVLGGMFIASQLLAWLALVERGLYMRGNPYAGFFYILTAAHAVHVIGGIIALGAVLLRNWYPTRRQEEITYRQNVARAVGWYWHFMGGLWIVLFVLLGFWK